MDPRRQSIPEAGAYRIVELVLRDLEAATRILENRAAVAVVSENSAGPDPVIGSGVRLDRIGL